MDATLQVATPLTPSVPPWFREYEDMVDLTHPVNINEVERAVEELRQELAPELRTMKASEKEVWLNRVAFLENIADLLRSP